MNFNVAANSIFENTVAPNKKNMPGSIQLGMGGAGCQLATPSSGHVTTVSSVPPRQLCPLQISSYFLAGLILPLKGQA